MKLSIAKTTDELDSLLASSRDTRKHVILVPTMGALHAGHISLVERAHQLENATVVASIFVNPTQFAEGEDLDKYPRTIEMDIQKLENADADILFLPDVEEIYPSETKATISAGTLAKRWDGEHRPGHFDGVATVVARLFELVKPDVAIFGEKDFQQLAIIQQMVQAGDMAVEVVGSPIIREADGLAMSSRNAYLSAEQRAIAPKLYETLVELKHGLIDADKAKQKLLDAGFSKIDYLATVESNTLEPLEKATQGARILVAAWLGSTRLIDNIGIE